MFKILMDNLIIIIPCILFVLSIYNTIYIILVVNRYCIIWYMDSKLTCAKDANPGYVFKTDNEGLGYYKDI